MKVVHLNTHDEGGAAIAALRLHKGLRLHGINSNFLTLYKKNEDNVAVHDYNLFLRRNYYERFYSSVKYRIQKMIFKRISGFSYPFSPYNVQNHPLIKQADIIHLHWVSGFVHVKTFVSALKVLGKPIVWTLHDLNTITGGYHYFGSGKIDHKLNEKYFLQKKKIIKSYDSIHMVSPSGWIYKMILESGLVGEKNAHLIKYGIDLQHFFPLNKASAKKKFNVIDPQKKVILFLATDIKDKRKGLSFLLKSLEYIPRKENVQFVCVGNGMLQESEKSGITFMGSISDPKMLVNIFSSADIFLIPSLEDNLPNTIIESLACGTPVIGFDTGGIPDLVLEKYNGFLAKKGDAKDLAKKINLLLENDNLLKELSINARSFVKDNCDSKIQAKKYIDLYNSILSKS